ncbi:MAG: beta-propeller fold lactonase family protein [Pirellulales bacterium]
MRHRIAVCTMIALATLAGGHWALRADNESPTEPRRATSLIDERVDRSPADLVLTPDEAWILSANQTSHTVSLVRASDGVVVDEAPCGRRPAAIAVTPDGRRALVTAAQSGELCVFEIVDQLLRPAGVVQLGHEPHGVAVSPDGRTAYVALAMANEVAVVDLESLKLSASISVGRWPRYLSLTPDGQRLAVGASGDGAICVVDTATRTRLYDTKFQGLNIGHLQVSSDGRYAYFPWMVYADRPITPGNIREGWVLGNRLARVRLDDQAPREALALDPRGRAVGDPHGLALAPDEQHVALAAAGTHELVVFRLDDLPLLPDGPGDHLPPGIAADEQRFFRIALGGRPMGIRFDRAGQRVYVANYLTSAIQVVNVAERRVEHNWALGPAPEPSLARRGEAIFYDAQRSVDGWYSCHSCHYEGGSNAVTMDTKNDGSFGTYKMVLSLRGAHQTGPWFWHGWQQDFPTAVRKSMGDTMQGPAPTDEDVQAMVAYLSTLSPRAGAALATNHEQSVRAERGKQLFESEVAGCATCHRGPQFTDGEVHDVGLGSSFDVAYQGYNTPSLLGIANRAGYLHHGRAKSLAELLTDLHSPAKVSSTRELTNQEVADLVAYLESL